MGPWKKLVLWLIAGGAGLAFWMRYDYRGVEIRVENKMFGILQDTRLASGTQTAHRSVIPPGEQWVVVLRPGGADPDIKLTFFDAEANECSVIISPQMRADTRVTMAAIVRSCRVVEISEESRE